MNRMGRREDLEKIVYKEGTDNQIKAERLIEEIVHLEEDMEYYHSLPSLKVDPKDPSRQKATPAAKLYKEALQQYNNSLRLLLRITGDLEESEEESPLRKWAKSREDFSLNADN